MKSIFKKANIILFILMITLSVCMLTVNVAYNVEATNQGVYIALGDSITEGYAYNLKNVDYSSGTRTITFNNTFYTGGNVFPLENDELSNLYVYKLAQRWSNQTSNSINFATSGDTCKDMLDFIDGFYDYELDTCKSSTSSNSDYTNLTNQQVFDYFKSASIITLDIGANNILSEAPALIQKYWGFAQNESITIQEMTAVLKNKLVGDSTTTFEYQFKLLLNKIYKLAPDAKIYIGNVYNPYKALRITNELNTYVQNLKSGPVGSLLSQNGYNINFSSSTVRDVAELAELAIAGGTDTNGQAFVGLNNIIENTLTEFLTTNTNAKFEYIDVKAKFDNIYYDNSKNYNDYINEDLNMLDQTTMSNAISGAISNPSVLTQTLTKYMDPHPTMKGNSVIYSAIVGEDEILAENINETTANKNNKFNLNRNFILYCVSVVVIVDVIVVIAIIIKKKRSNSN